jgi:hypothetical protein
MMKRRFSWLVVVLVGVSLLFLPTLGWTEEEYSSGDKLEVTATATLTGGGSLEVTFEASTSGGNCDSYAYTWTGDGVSGTGDSITKTFNEPGTYEATVTVQCGEETASDTVSVEVIILPEGWDLELWRNYQEYSQVHAQELIAQGEPTDCADFALEIYVDFCETNNISIEFEVWNASEREWMTVRREDFPSEEEFLDYVQENMGAVNILSDRVTMAIDFEDLQVGDLLVTSDGGADYTGDTMVITDIRENEDGTVEYLTAKGNMSDGEPVPPAQQWRTEEEIENLMDPDGRNYNTRRWK